ncbi:MAG: hypothetical protein IH919_10440, partial [Deltaproteobacteria bacterium]|nr:hypothetical protein [Deltaproteobacteria bacterium]
LGFDLPYFCWHPALGSVGSCRQCAVRKYQGKEDQQGQIVMACMEPVLDDLHISIDEKEVAVFRKNVIEWLMVNHPHDCPICDEGGECHLQDKGRQRPAQAGEALFSLKWRVRALSHHRCAGRGLFRLARDKRRRPPSKDRDHVARFHALGCVHAPSG